MLKSYEIFLNSVTHVNHQKVYCSSIASATIIWLFLHVVITALNIVFSVIWYFMSLETSCI